MTFQMTPEHRKETAGKHSEGKGVNMPSRYQARDPLALNEGRPVGRAGICFSVPGKLGLSLKETLLRDF